MSGKAKILRKTIEDLERKRSKAKKDQNIKCLAEIVKELGDAYYESKQYEKALSAYKEQLELCQNLDQQLNCAIAHRRIGEVYAENGNFSEALQHEKFYLEIAEELDNFIEMQRAYLTLGRTYFLLAGSHSDWSEESDKKEALKNSKSNYEQSIKICDQLEYKITNREWQTMKAGLLLNLGLVLDEQKDPGARKCMEKARSICEKIQEDDTLYRVNIALSSHYENSNNIEMAFKYLNDASRVKDEDLKIEAELSKAELFLRLGKWPEARKILYKMYRYSKMLDVTREQVKKLLRIAVVLHRGESEVLLENRISVQEKLYERMGDAAVAIKSWNKAIEYYSNMLSCAEKSNSDQLGPALTSLYQTLRDAGKITEAIPYARRELELCISKKNSKDACNSALCLAGILNEAGYPLKEIKEIYEEAWSLAKKSTGTSLERLVIQNFIEFLKKAEDLDLERIEKLSERLDDLHGSQSSPESETEPESMEIGEDIDLEEITDYESDGGFQEPKRRKLTYKKKKMRNELGESPLHVACIRGDVAAVEKLLEEKHPTDVRDNAGWTPLHEASNNGHLEIVKLLINAGASVNDQGGDKCEKITPLHDAASNGHMDIINLLLDNGGNPSLLTKNGDDVLEYLISWKNREENVLDEKQKKDYNFTKERLKKLNKNRSNKRKSNERRSNALYSSDEEDGSVLGKTPEKSKPERISAGEDYKLTMNSLKHPGRVIFQPVKEPPPKNTAPLIDNEEILLDPWLEDDIGKQRKNKSYFNGMPYIVPSEPTVKRKSKDSDLENEKVESTFKRPKLVEETQGPKISLDEDPWEIADNFSFENIYEPERVEQWPSKKKTPRQTNLFKQGFTKNVRSPSPITEDLEKSYTPPIEKRYSWEGISEIDLKITVEHEVFNIKLTPQELRKSLKVIQNIIRHQFETETGCRPQIKFLSTDGIYLDENITLEEIPGDKNKISLTGCIIENKLPGIVERYTKICEKFLIEPSEEMLKDLKKCDRSFTLNPDCGQKELEPLMKCLHYQKTIHKLNLSSARFYDCSELLSYTLKGLTNLSELCLQNCDIDQDFLDQIEILPSGIQVLDLSYNPLGIGGKNQKKLLQLLKPLKYLQNLNLRSCFLENFEDDLSNPSILYLDISWNPMDAQSIVNLLQNQLISLNLECTHNPASKTENIIDRIFHSQLNLNDSLGFSWQNLEILNLTNCAITNIDVDQILFQAPNLMSINLSCNKNVTKLSLCRLLRRKPTLNYINLLGCALINGLPEDNTKIVTPQSCELLVDMNPEVIDAWEKLWEGTVTAKKLPMNLTIFRPRSNDLVS